LALAGPVDSRCRTDPAGIDPAYTLSPYPTEARRKSSSSTLVGNEADLTLKGMTTGLPDHLVGLEEEGWGDDQAQGVGEVFPDKASNFWEFSRYPRSGS
jgi:hypothetical protein